jgi:hypothetical protein
MVDSEQIKIRISLNQAQVLSADSMITEALTTGTKRKKMKWPPGHNREKGRESEC